MDTKMIFFVLLDCRISRCKIETVFSQIVSLVPRSIHTVTAKGFFLKVYPFIVAFSINNYMARL